jgi:hypothetical protein
LCSHHFFFFGCVRFCSPFAFLLPSLTPHTSQSRL